MVFAQMNRLVSRLCGLWLQQPLFLQGTDSLRAERQRHFLSVNNKCLLLQVRLEPAFCATQRKADVVARLRALSRQITS